MGLERRYCIARGPHCGSLAKRHPFRAISGDFSSSNSLAALSQTSLPPSPSPPPRTNDRATPSTCEFSHIASVSWLPTRYPPHAHRRPPCPLPSGQPSRRLSSGLKLRLPRYDNDDFLHEAGASDGNAHRRKRIHMHFSEPRIIMLIFFSKERELEWIVQETLDVCRDLKHGLDDCYALLAPIDPGSTLVMSTPRNEKVKGTLTRVGTRIVKGSLHIQLRTVQAQTLSLSPSDDIHIPALESLHTHLTQAIDLLSITLSKPQDHQSLASTLSILADSFCDSLALLKGPPINRPDPGWQDSSCPPHHFQPNISSNMSIYLNIQESSIILWLRALEPADAPVHFGMKLGLAIGTVRRLEHDEMDTIFKYNTRGNDVAISRPRSARHTPEPRAPPPAFGNIKPIQDVYVREKVRVESADPSLISLFSKLGYLSRELDQARRNLGAVMGVTSDD